MADPKPCCFSIYLCSGLTAERVGESGRAGAPLLVARAWILLWGEGFPSLGLCFIPVFSRSSCMEEKEP